jgi:dienelactone hydrolase
MNVSFAALCLYDAIKERPTMKYSIKFLLVAAALVLGGMSSVHSNAAALSNLSEGQKGRIEFESITPVNLWTYARRNMTDTKQVVVFGDLLMPKTINGKVPALVIMHGSAGVEPWAYDLWAARLNTAGAAVFVVDSFKPRGVGSTSSDQFDSRVSIAAQTADALNALRILATHPQIDSSRIYVIGMSRGGNPAFYSAWPMYQRPVNTNGAKFAGHIPLYPGMCNIRYRADANAKATGPIFFALADRDKEDFQDVAVCERYAQELAASGNAVTSKEYKGAYHAWDGGARRFRYENSHIGKTCDMELEMTDVAGGGLGRNAKDLKTGKQLTSYAEWDAAINRCMGMHNAALGGNPSQSDAVVEDVLKFMGVK